MMLLQHKIKPIKKGWLPAVDGHEIFYHTYGNPEGEPVLIFHSATGGRSEPTDAKKYNLKKYYLIMFDQRGCGSSQFKDLLYKNTPMDIVSDTKRLLETLNISQKITLTGHSWGAFMALLFAETYPELISKIWISSVFLARYRDNQEWWDQDAIRFYPDFISILQEKAGDQEITDYFATELLSGDKKREREAMKYYGSLESIVGDTAPRFTIPDDKNYDKELSANKIYVNMAINHFFLGDNYIIENAYRIKHIPTKIFHNRLDLCCPFEQAWELHNVLPHSELYVIPASGHSSPEMEKRLKELFNS